MTFQKSANKYTIRYNIILYRSSVLYSNIILHYRCIYLGTPVDDCALYTWESKLTSFDIE
jgi:hypothetical protein